MPIINAIYIATVKSVLLVSGVDDDSSGRLDVLHTDLGNAEVSRVFLLGDDGPPIDLGHHRPAVATLLADALELKMIS